MHHNNCGICHSCLANSEVYVCVCVCVCACLCHELQLFNALIQGAFGCLLLAYDFPDMYMCRSLSNNWSHFKIVSPQCDFCVFPVIHTYMYDSPELPLLLGTFIEVCDDNIEVFITVHMGIAQLLNTFAKLSAE